MKTKEVINKVKDTAKSVKSAVVEKATAAKDVVVNKVAATEKVAKVIAARTKGAIAYQKVIESGNKPESYVKVGEILKRIKEADKKAADLRKVLENLKSELIESQFSTAQKSLLLSTLLDKYA